ncbi:MAG: hypothetical protein IBJ09_11770 [Bacteroidia bacterium]|nr:hypothetical protein [Bacteroidia bacterium]
MNTRIVYAVLIAILFAGCGNRRTKVPHSDKRFVAIDSFEIQTGFMPSSVYSGFVQVGDSGYLYLANLLVHDSIHFYTYPELKKRKVIPLTTIMDRGYELYNIQVASLDSIMLMGRYHNILFTIDDKGNIINERDLNPLADADSFHIDLDLLRGNNQNLFTFNGKQYLLLNAANSSVKPYPQSSVADAYRLYGSRYTDPSLALYSLNDNTLRLDSLALFRPLNPEGKFMTTNALYGYVRFQNNVLLLTPTSDTLYVINPERLSLERKIQITYSEMDKIGAKPTPISEENIANASKLFTESMLKGGYLSYLFTDWEHTHVFVAIIPSRSQEEIDNKTDKGITFIVLDRNLEPVDEEYFFSPTTRVGFNIAVSNGFLFSLDTPNNPNFDETKARFALYRYE